MSPLNEIWRGREEKRWVYRGQSDDQYTLTPKSLREGGRLRFTDPNIKSPLSSRDQINAEAILLLLFAQAADAVGLNIPGFIEELRHFYAFDKFGIEIGGNWPHPRLLELSALAQHHGVPTRLMDFSYSPFVAAYFAATQAVEDEKSKRSVSGSKIAIWGIDLSFIYNTWSPFHFGGDIGKGKVRIVEIHRATNLFLFRQQALFIYDQNEIRNFEKYGIHFPIEEIVRDAAKIVDRDDPRYSDCYPPIIKIMINKSHSEEILKQLMRYYIYKSFLMPTFDNVVKDLTTRDLELMSV